MKHLTVNAVNAVAFEDTEPVSRMLIAFHFNVNVGEAAHALFRAESNPADRELLQNIADAHECTAYTLGKILDYTTYQTHNTIQRALAAIKRAAETGTPYRIPGSMFLFMPDGTRQPLERKED